MASMSRGYWSGARRVTRAGIYGVVGLLALSASGRADLGEHGLQTWIPGECCMMGQETELFFGTAVAIGDFDEDGHGDLAIGARGATIIGGQHAGKVAVLRGTAYGPTLAGQVSLTETELGGAPGIGQDFGAALAVGDWNDDGADDLAIGVPDDTNSGGIAAGGVYVIYGNDAETGTPGELFSDEFEYWSYATVVLGGWANPMDRFGASLATGDFDGDGFDDLAIGVPFDNVFVGNTSAGSVTVLMGGPFGLIPGGGNTFHRNTLFVPGVVQDGELFGAALAAGDFDGDGQDELVVGAPGAHVDGAIYVGEAIVLEFEIQGSGIDVSGGASWSEGHGIPGAPEDFDWYAWMLTVGDFDGDGADDLAIGASAESVGVQGGAGAVALLEGEAGQGLEATATLWTQDDLPLQNIHESEGFGAALASGDFDADGFADLVVGAPGDLRFVQDPGGSGWVAAGAVHVVPGSPAGPALAAAQTWVGTPGDLEDDNFGGSLAAGSLRGRSDALAIGSTRWGTGGMWDVGRLTVLFSHHLFSDGFETGDTTRWSTTLP